MVFSTLPTPSTQRIALHVTHAAENAIQQGHPWLFDNSITKQNHNGQPGDLAVIFNRKDNFHAIGLYDPTSSIRVRVLHQGEPTPIDGEYFAAQIHQAAGRRAPLLENQTEGYRLIHGENDGLPGCIVDRYAHTLVIKLYTPAWIPHLRDIGPALLEATSAERLVLRLSRSLQAETDLLFGLEDGQTLWGSPPQGPIMFQENGLTFAADVVHGHKTGFFFDQRDNRQRVRNLAWERDVLDVFAYSGGFSVYAAAGGAHSVLSVDTSLPALHAAQDNMALNAEHTDSVKHDILAVDAFQGLAALAGEQRRFDLVVVDPPAFANSEDQIDGALGAYTKLTQLALGVLQEQGLLVMASCSSRVPPDAFFSTVFDAAAQAGRPLLEQWRTGHALDHPIGFPEGEYLKCLFATAID